MFVTRKKYKDLLLRIEHLEAIVNQMKFTERNKPLYDIGFERDELIVISRTLIVRTGDKDLDNLFDNGLYYYWQYSVYLKNEKLLTPYNEAQLTNLLKKNDKIK